VALPCIASPHVMQHPTSGSGIGSACCQTTSARDGDSSEKKGRKATINQPSLQ